MHAHSSEVDQPTAVAVLQPGYRFTTSNVERVLRPARVAVAEPGPSSEPGPVAEPGPSSEQASAQ